MVIMSNISGDRNSTPAASRVRNTIGSGLTRTSADASSLMARPDRPDRPSSDYIGGQGKGKETLDPQDKAARQWIDEIDEYEHTLEDMAAATLDQDFKDELSAIEQWFRVLTEAERTAALYALLKQTTHVQIRFFIALLQQKGKDHPMHGVLSPASTDKDPMSSRLDGAMNRMSVGDPARTSGHARPNARQSGLDSARISQMFPDAAAALATEKAKFTQQTGNPPTSNRNSTVDRSSLAPVNSTIDRTLAPTISGPNDDGSGQNPQSPWAQNDARPVSSSGQAPMGQFAAPQAGGGLRSPRPPQLSSNSTIQNTTLQAPGDKLSDLPLLSPAYGGSGNWASMASTPMVSNFPAAQSHTDQLANAALMKLSAMSTVNNRFALNDARQFRRARSNDAPGRPQNQIQPANVVMVNEHGQSFLGVPNPQAVFGGFHSNSRPNSPGIAMHGGFGPGMPFPSQQTPGYLTPYNGLAMMGVNNGLGAMNMGQFGVGAPEGYLSDHSDIARGRSPRGRRGSSKPPEDPLDPRLLQDIPSWLRSLRLHKYTDHLKDMKWADLVELSDQQLEERGVNALGARRKMLKVFEQVKDAKAEGKLG